MSKKIDWLENFAESYSKEIKKNTKTASRVKNELIIEKSLVKGAKLGDKVKLNGKMYRIADLDFEDEKGPGVVIEEMEEPMVEEAPELAAPPALDPMVMEMGAEVAPVVSAPERAVADPGDVYDLDVRSQEQAKFEGEAAETERVIQEDAVNVDLTQRSHEVKPARQVDEVAPMVPEMEVAPVIDAPVEPAMEEVCPECEEAPMEEEVCPECEEAPMEEEVCPECEEVPMEEEMDEEDEEEIKPLASNRIFRRIMASKRR
ncbi:MAG: hypothetical protein J6B98_05305 [Bacilli bacterium]|nr:hypothetical protein [Bacilli bacterium]